MKKILVIPAIIGLIAVPSVAFAQHSADDDNDPNNVRQEDRQQDRQNDNAATPATPADPNAQNANENENEMNDDNDEDANNQPPVAANAVAVNQDQATAIAMTAMPGKAVKKVQSESEGGTAVFSVRFTDGSRVDVRASDGAVVRTKTKTNKNMVNSNSQSQSGRHGGGNDNGNSNRGRGSDD
jgi:uncharacterized membrane protein YkoI